MNWKISAPYIYVVELSAPGGIGDPGRLPLAEKEWLDIFDKILPTSRHIFLEGDEPLDHPDIFPILDFLESRKAAFSILTDGLRDDTDGLLLKLRKYAALEKIRFAFPREFQPGKSALFEKFRANLAGTVAAGISSFVVIPQGKRQCGDEMLSALLETGIKGIIFSLRPSRSGGFDPNEVVSRAENLSASGLPVFIEGCAPTEFRPGDSPRCGAGDALSFIDSSGNLLSCIKAGLSTGSLRDKSVEELWADSQPRRWGRGKNSGACVFRPDSSRPVRSASSPAPGPAVNLDLDLIPVRLFDLRKEKFGAILIKGYHHIPVAKEALRMLALIDGRHSLGEIDGKFGRIGLSFTFGLFAQNMIRFDRPACPPAAETPARDGYCEHGATALPQEATDSGFPAGPTRDIPAEDLPVDWFCKASPGLYVSRRNSRFLVVEPESASWCILSEKQYEVLSRIDRLGGALLGDITRQAVLERSRLNELIILLFQRNMISINGKTYFDPGEMWKIQEYPHYFNIHMTEACNLACKYCRINSAAEAPVMSPETCRAIVRRVMEEIPSSPVIFSFHGGEPLLNMDGITAGAREAHKLSKELGKPVKLVMQTNATLLSPEAARLLRENSIDVGVSIDGPECIHDERRIYHTGEGSHGDVVRGIRAAAGAGVPVGYLAVVHDPLHYPRVLDYLVGEMGAVSLRINYSAFDGRGKEELEFPVDRAESFAREWLKILDYAESFHEETGKWLNISDLNLFVFHLVSKVRPHMCYRSPCGVGNSILGFAPDGKIYLCDEVVGNPDFLVGDIFEPVPLREMLDKSAVKKSVMNLRRLENIARCSKCVWKHFHGGGCASKTFSHFGILSKEDPMCRFYEVVFEELMWRLAEKPRLVNLCGSYREHLDIDSAMDYIRNGF